MYEGTRMKYQIMAGNGLTIKLDLIAIVNNIFKSKNEEKYYILSDCGNFVMEISKSDIPHILKNQMEIP